MVGIKRSCWSLLAATIFTLTMPVAYAATVCDSALSDSDGDGWGWENQQSCIVAPTNGVQVSPQQPPETIPTATTPSSSISPHPACTDATSDSDGDGFGWEQNRTCLVVSSAPATPELPATPVPTEPASPAVPPTSRFPTCEFEGSDPDGDGFGWENNTTCAVAGDLTPVVNETPEPLAPSGHPICQQANSDPDGDGFGWENLGTCVVVADDQTGDDEQTSDSDGPTERIRFMAVGDSITHGGIYDDVETVSYRSTFTTLMNAAGCNYEMTGSQTSNHQHDGFVSPHESYAGHRADDFLNGRNNGAGNNEGIAVALQRYNPDAVLLFLGTNDILQGQDISQTTAELDQVIAFILDANAKVFVANVTPVFRTTARSRIDQYGDQIEAYVAQLANPMVTLIDVRSDFTRAMMLDDNLHPNEAGDEFVGNAFFDGVLDTGYCTG